MIARLRLVFHEKDRPEKLFEFTMNSKPSFLVLPIFWNTLLTPFTADIARFNKRSVVLLRYALISPVILELNRPKSNPRFKAFVVSHPSPAVPSVAGIYPGAGVDPSM